MSELKLYTGNQLEILVEKLADLLNANSLQSPFEPEIIIVQSRGMERWLSMGLADHLGICANIRFPFPNSFVQEVFKKFIPDMPEESPFDPEILTWKIMKLLPNLIDSPDFEDLQAYLKFGKTDLKLFQLARRIADTFDQYTVFRPEMILNWDIGKGSGWQAKLWQHLSRENDGFHRAALKQRYIELIRNGSISPHDLPARISVFGISALPPIHIQVLAGLANLIEVNLFLMNPCREFWDDIVSDRETDKITRKEKSQKLSADELYLERGNSLLASTGALGRDFFWQIHQYPCQEDDFYKQSSEDSLLACIQSDILNLKERDGQTAGFKQIPDSDNSIQVHSCHGPMREIEVLYDSLLAMFDSDPGLKPRDILVMTPDIEIYAPFVQAVFGGQKGAAYIPFSIADRNIAQESPLIKSFIAILDLAGSRFEVSKISDILESPHIYRKFGLAAGDIELILHWLKKTGIRWGIDKPHRQKLGLPGTQENTWRAGLDRLLLGYAMPCQEQTLFENILPYDNIEGDQAQTLGKLADFIDRLIAVVDSLAISRTLDNWVELLTEVCDSFILADNESDREMIVIRRAINNLGYLREKSGFDDKLSFDIINQYLKDYFARESSGFGFIAGAVTFCAMLPMRSIPFKVICLVGMNHDSYPHQEKHLSFDLIAKHPQRGDRSIRNSDRYLFLEAILSARQRLYISHIGQSIEDNSPIPPSVLVSELLDYINQGFEVAGYNILDHIVTKHRLQAFSPYYFSGDNRLFSYSEENYQAARSGLNRRDQPNPYITAGLPEAGVEYRTLDIDQLCGFFANPAKFLLRERLGIYFDDAESFLEDREPYDISGLEKYELNNRLLEKALAGNDIGKEYNMIKAEGILPHGKFGESVFNNLVGDIKIFAGKLAGYRLGDKFEPLTIDFQIAGFHLTGLLDNIYPDGPLHYRAASVKAKDRLKIWLKHLVYNIIKPDSYPANSTLIGTDSCLQYLRVENAAEILGQLLDLYWIGLHKPLTFFPDSSLNYAESVAKGQTERQALSKAIGTWIGSDNSRGESEDDYYKTCFGGFDPFDDMFKAVSLNIYRPLLKYQTKLG